MPWLANALTWLAGDLISEAVRVRLAEAQPAAGSIEDEDAGYRRLTGKGQRDLAPIKHARMLEIAHYLARTNPFAGWLLDTTRDFLCGEGVSVVATDTRIQEVIDAFWADPINRMASTWPDMVRELSLFGEQCWPVFVQEGTGLMRLATVDPSWIKEVVHDPDNAREPIGVVLRDSAGQAGKKLRILKGGEDKDLFAPEALRLREQVFVDGDCFYWAINKSSSCETRGISDLYSLADWLDGYEQLLWNGLQRVGFLNAFCWDVRLEDMDQEQINAWKRDNPPPQPGSVFAHNQKVTLDAKAPDLKGADNADHARLVRNQILGGAGLPEHWYGGGGDVNRATAAEMSTPTIKRFQFRQRTVKHMLEQVILLQIRLAQERQRSLAEADTSFELIFPRIAAADLQAAATALKDLAASALIAEANGWITKAQAAKLFAAASALLGVDIEGGEGAEVDDRVTPDYAEDEGAVDANA